MRIKEFNLGFYKNLEGNYSFKTNSGYIALIGINGSGKSNLLEVISIIFNQILGIQDNDIIDYYDVTYNVNGNDVTLYNIDRGQQSELPSMMISCYSGEDTRLWDTCYKKYYTEFFTSAVRKNGEYKPKSLYINKFCWKIAFLTLLYSEEVSIHDFLKDKLNIDVSSVKIKFTEKEGNMLDHDASKWYQRVKEELGNNFFTIEQLKSIELLNSKYIGELTDDAILFFYLYLLSMPEKNEKTGMTVDKIIDEIDIEVDGYSFDNLSEGEKKLILIECITKVLGDKESLVLLDEPDAHTHVAMKKELLKLISEFEGQTIMTTHSPMFLNKRWEGFNENNIFYMHEGKMENTEPLKHLADLTNNEIDYFEGSFILSSKKILVVEGKNDDKYLRKAISIFAQKDVKYNKLNDIAIFSANSAGAAEVIYNQVLLPCIDKIENLVFLFDYDDAGWKDGWKKIEAIHTSKPNVIPMFYQDNYFSTAYPTSDIDVKSVNGDKKEIKNENSFMVEDLFSENSYANIIRPVISARKHKDFRMLTLGKKGTAGAIKTHIENNYNTFNDEWYDGFKPVLDKLMEVFDLNK